MVQRYRKMPDCRNQGRGVEHEDAKSAKEAASLCALRASVPQLRLIRRLTETEAVCRQQTGGETPNIECDKYVLLGVLQMERSSASFLFCPFCPFRP